MKPILFKSELILAILDGCKTQTRRIIKPQPAPSPFSYQSCGVVDGEAVFRSILGHANNPPILHYKCPYGKVGDKLWVRENVRTICYGRGDEFAYGEHCIEYIADKQLVKCPDEHDKWWRHNWHVRPSTTIPSIHMPKWACRIFLEITGIKVEKVQDITEADAEAEGILCPGWYSGEFRKLWDSINKKRGFGWDMNPYNWVVKFKKEIQ